MCDAGLLYNNTLLVGLSLHKESKGKDLEFIGLCRKLGFKIVSTLFVIDDIRQIDEAVNVYRENKDVVMSMRIKAATKIGHEKKSIAKIFTSDMINYLKKFGKISLDLSRNNKISFANILLEDMHIMPISWYDINNVDLEDIDCPPFYRSSNGRLYNLATALIRNEMT